MDPIIKDIVLNFASELDKFTTKDSSSKINEYFNDKGIKSPAILKGFSDSIVIASSNDSKGNGPAVIKYNNNNTVYVGSIVNGKRSGFGVRSYVGNELAYIGDYNNDIKSGKGDLFDLKKNKVVFTGAWARDRRNGYGELDKGTIWYKGNYVDDRMEGKGKQQWENGDYYEGDFRGDLRHGNGFMRFASGDEYNGTFTNGFMHGQGVYTWKNGEKFIGEFTEGKMGEGRIDYGINVTGEGTFENQSYRHVTFGLTGEFGKY
jgi:hypothetical protein